jgi:hypothetical protein
MLCPWPLGRTERAVLQMYRWRVSLAPDHVGATRSDARYLSPPSTFHAGDGLQDEADGAPRMSRSATVRVPLVYAERRSCPLKTLYDLDARLGAGTHEVRVLFKWRKTPREDAGHNEPALAKEVCDNDGCFLIGQRLKSLDDFAYLHSRNQNALDGAMERQGLSFGSCRSLVNDVQREGSLRCHFFPTPQAST